MYNLCKSGMLAIFICKLSFKMENVLLNQTKSSTLERFSNLKAYYTDDEILYGYVNDLNRDFRDTYIDNFDIGGSY